MTARMLPGSALMTLAFLLAPIEAAAQLAVDNDTVQIRSSSDRGMAQVLLDNLPPSSDLRAVSIARGTWLRSERIVSPVTGSGFATQPYLVERFTFANDSREVIAHFRARAADSSPVALRVIDRDGRVHCLANGTGGAGATCTARVAHREFFGRTVGAQFELLVEAEQRGVRSTSVTVEGFFHSGFPETSDLELTVDPIVRADGTASMTLPINVRTYAPGKVLAELIELRDGDRPLRRFVARTEWDGSVPAASLALFSDRTPTRASTTHAGISTHRRLPFLIPANVDSVDISLQSYEAPEGAVHPRGTPNDLALELHYLDGDPALAQVDAVPPGRTPEVVIDAEPARMLPDTASERFILRGAQLRPGRWFAVPVSKTGIPLNVFLTLQFPTGRALEPADGHYFNPSRPGHGFYLAEAGNDWVLIWYTYDSIGAPVWYYAQGPRPSVNSGGSQWFATLYRNVWNGSRTRFQFVGSVQLAMTGEGRLTFAHLVNGTLGIEPMQRLGGPGCTQQWLNQPFDVNGLWYSPDKSGYGFSAEMIGGSEFFLAYAYDALGRPRWATAQQAFNAAVEAPLLQAKGFCPTCTATSITRDVIGRLERSISNAASPDGRPGFGLIGLEAQWAQGIPGGWSERRTVSLLSARASCQ